MRAHRGFPSGLRSNLFRGHPISGAPRRTGPMAPLPLERGGPVLKEMGANVATASCWSSACRRLCAPIRGTFKDTTGGFLVHGAKQGTCKGKGGLDLSPERITWQGDRMAQIHTFLACMLTRRRMFSSQRRSFSAAICFAVAYPDSKGDSLSRACFAQDKSESGHKQTKRSNTRGTSGILKIILKNKETRGRQEEVIHKI